MEPPDRALLDSLLTRRLPSFSCFLSESWGSEAVSQFRRELERLASDAANLPEHRAAIRGTGGGPSLELAPGDGISMASLLLVLDYLKTRPLNLGGDLFITPAAEQNGPSGGAFRFRCVTYGRPAPSCRVEKGISAITMAFTIMDHLRQWAAWEGRGALLTLSSMQGGEWVGTVPQKCVFDAVVSFPALVPPEEIRDSLQESLRLFCAGGEWPAGLTPLFEYGECSLRPVPGSNDRENGKKSGDTGPCGSAAEYHSLLVPAR